MAGRAAAKVHTGMRGSDTIQRDPGRTHESKTADPVKEQLERLTEMEQSHKPQKNGEVVFISRYRGHLIQLTSPAELGFDYATGRRIEGAPNLAAKFENNVFRTADEKSLELLRKHPRYGIDFWEAEKKKAEAKERVYQSLESAALSDPALARRLKEKLDGFDLPARENPVTSEE